MKKLFLAVLVLMALGLGCDGAPTIIDEVPVTIIEQPTIEEGVDALIKQAEGEGRLPLKAILLTLQAAIISEDTIRLMVIVGMYAEMCLEELESGSSKAQKPNLDEKQDV